MIAHRHEQVEEDFSPVVHNQSQIAISRLRNIPHLHLHLHGATALEGLTTANNQSEVVSAQSRVTVWCVVVRVTC